jgi:N-acetylmuramoyl-L-alanine amidase
MSQEILSEPNIDEIPPSPRRPARFSIWHALQTLVGVAVVTATLFTMWTPANLFSNNLLDQMMRAAQSSQATPVTMPTLSSRLRIGIISGHMGNDPGAVCPDGLTESEVNYKIAELLTEKLKANGFEVDLLEEFDARLYQFKGVALVSIHNDSCVYVSDEFTGYKVAASRESTAVDSTNKLYSCLVDRYAKDTKKPFHANTVTNDMKDYHAFREIDKQTPAVIIETGFLATDRNFLVNNKDQVAAGIYDGLLCYVRNEPVNPTPTAKP